MVRLNRMRAFVALLAAIPLVMMSACGGPKAYAQASTTAPQQNGQQGKPLIGADDRPYDTQLFHLAEILGAVHYLRELCGGNEGQVWREQMRELVTAEGTNALRKAKLVESFNRGYRGYSRTYRTCTQPALTAINRFMEQAATISDAILANDK